MSRIFRTSKVALQVRSHSPGAGLRATRFGHRIARPVRGYSSYSYSGSAGAHFWTAMYPIRQRLITTFGRNVGYPVQTRVAQFARQRLHFVGRRLPIFLGVDEFAHQAHSSDLSTRRHSLHIPVKIDCATLPAGV